MPDRGAAAKTRAEWLEEARLLEMMGGEWEVGHAAAFCLVSESFIMRGECPKIEKSGIRDVKGKSMIRFSPAAVREWNARRTKAA